MSLSGEKGSLTVRPFVQQSQHEAVHADVISSLVRSPNIFMIFIIGNTPNQTRSSPTKMIFLLDEYDMRWKLADAALDAEVVWRRTASTFDQAGDLIWLTNYFSSKVGQVFDAPPFNARAFAAVFLRRGEAPVLITDDPDVYSGVVSIADDPVATTVATLRDLGVTDRVGFVGTDFFLLNCWCQLSALAPEIDWHDSDDLIRMVKLPREPAAIRIGGATEAAAAALAAEYVVLRSEVMDKIQVSHGATVGYTCGNPLTGYRQVAPAPGELLRCFVIGPFYQGYYLDHGRTAVCGNLLTKVQAEPIEGCADIVEAVAATIRPGVSFHEPAVLSERLTAAFGPDSNPPADKFPFFGHPHRLFSEGPPMSASSSSLAAPPFRRAC